MNVICKGSVFCCWKCYVLENKIISNINDMRMGDTTINNIMDTSVCLYIFWLPILNIIEFTKFITYLHKTTIYLHIFILRL